MSAPALTSVESLEQPDPSPSIGPHPPTQPTITAPVTSSVSPVSPTSMFSPISPSPVAHIRRASTHKPTLLQKLFHIHDENGSPMPVPTSTVPPNVIGSNFAHGSMGNDPEDLAHVHPQSVQERRPSSGSSIMDKLFHRAVSSNLSTTTSTTPAIAAITPKLVIPTPAQGGSLSPSSSDGDSYFSSPSPRRTSQPGIIPALPPGSGAALLREPRVPVPGAPATPDIQPGFSPTTPASVSPTTSTLALNLLSETSREHRTVEDRYRRKSTARSPGRPATANGHGGGQQRGSHSPGPTTGRSSANAIAADPLSALRRVGSEATLSERWGEVSDEIIGRGATSVVRLVRSRCVTGGGVGGPGATKMSAKEAVGNKGVGKDEVYAVKEFRRRRREESEREYVKKVTSEFCIGSSLHHPSIISTLDLLRTTTGSWCEVLEYCTGGDLCALIQGGGLQFEEANGLWCQMVNGVAYMHGLGVAHRDLKPENLMLQPPNVLKITDFGSAEVFRTVWETEPHKSRRLAGSEPYIAPEEFTAKEFDPVKVDAWACGIIYLTMIYNRIPWRAATSSDVNYSFYLKCLRRVSSSASPTAVNNTSLPDITTGFPMLDHLPPGPRNLILSLLDPDPARRMNVIEARKQVWFRSVVKDRVERGDEALEKSDGETERIGASGLALGQMQPKPRIKDGHTHIATREPSAGMVAAALPAPSNAAKREAAILSREGK
ncbi:serine/threonine-protein kinase HAL4/sat4 [Gonapodya sp. JEL0774]|nr:serine/threonine-protein kinase HAL4/sat4 [Gonapodya sp. JEL0774]